MEKEEILARSKQENRGKDMVDLEVSKSGIQIGWIAAVCLLAMVSVVDAMVYERMNSGIFFAVCSGCSAIFAYKYMKLRRKHELFVALLEGAAAILFFISWILQLTK